MELCEIGINKVELTPHVQMTPQAVTVLNIIKIIFSYYNS